MSFRIAPSILSADFARLGEEVKAVERAGADLIHFDVMDNHYVPNLTVGPVVCAALRPHVKLPLDVHLMVKPVDALVSEFAKAGASIISFHPEATEHVDRTIAPFAITHLPEAPFSFCHLSAIKRAIGRMSLTLLSAGDRG